jgi:hypothetical protein
MKLGSWKISFLFKEGKCACRGRATPKKIITLISDVEEAHQTNREISKKGKCKKWEQNFRHDQLKLR